MMGGALAGALLAPPLYFAMSGSPWIWLASGAIMGALYGPIFQPRDDPYAQYSA
jgi:hypothetical protein